MQELGTVRTALQDLVKEKVRSCVHTDTDCSTGSTGNFCTETLT